MLTKHLAGQLVPSPYLHLPALRQSPTPSPQLEHLNNNSLLSTIPASSSSLSLQDPPVSGLSIEALLKVGSKMKSAEGVYKANPGPDGANLFIYHLPQVRSKLGFVETKSFFESYDIHCIYSKISFSHEIPDNSVDTYSSSSLP